MEITNHILFLPMFFLIMYLWLEAQDLGVSLSLAVAARSQSERKAALKLLKPGVDGNEIWAFLSAAMIGALYANGDFMIPPNVFLPLGILLVGMVVRLEAAFAGRIFHQPIFLNGLCFVGIINVVAAGVLALELTNSDIFTGTAILGLIWLFLSCIQMGAVYGACKVVNPLGERFRATFLITNILSMITFIAVFAGGYIFGENGTPMKGLLVSGASLAVILSAVSFFAARFRKVYLGMLFAYGAHWLAVCVYVFTMMADVSVPAQNISYAEANTLLILGAAVLTGVVFIWKMCRRKIEYVWEDHI